MPIGKTARIQQADRQFGKHLNQIKKNCENQLSRETRCIEEVFKLEMLQHELQFQEAVALLRKIQHVSHRRDAAMKRSFETILERFSFSSVYDSETTLPPVPGIPRHKLPPRTAPAKLKSKPKSSSKTNSSASPKLNSKPKCHSSGSKAKPNRALSKATSSWKKIKITLPRCVDNPENQTPGTERTRNTLGGLYSNEPSDTSLLGLSITRRFGRRATQDQQFSRFQVPAGLATKPIPRARDRYLQAMQQKISLNDIKECAYLRISSEMRSLKSP
ncbi:hypothetical protein ACHWQZ_G017710 [Mnemiopsis leidyi]